LRLRQRLLRLLRGLDRLLHALLGLGHRCRQPLVSGFGWIEEPSELKMRQVGSNYYNPSPIPERKRSTRVEMIGCATMNRQME
jgi:hypothetical protein